LPGQQTDLPDRSQHSTGLTQRSFALRAFENWRMVGAFCPATCVRSARHREAWTLREGVLRNHRRHWFRRYRVVLHHRTMIAGD
jgi:hypothetical protein